MRDGSGFLPVHGRPSICYVAFSYSDRHLGQRFKLFGGIGLMLLFVLAQAFVLAPHIKDKESE